MSFAISFLVASVLLIYALIVTRIPAVFPDEAPSRWKKLLAGLAYSILLFSGHALFLLIGFYGFSGLLLGLEYILTPVCAVLLSNSAIKFLPCRTSPAYFQGFFSIFFPASLGLGLLLIIVPSVPGSFLYGNHPLPEISGITFFFLAYCTWRVKREPDPLFLTDFRSASETRIPKELRDTLYPRWAQKTEWPFLALSVLCLGIYLGILLGEGYFPSLNTPSSPYFQQTLETTYDEGYEAGKEAGNSEGYASGYSDGYDDGDLHGYFTGFGLGASSQKEYDDFLRASSSGS